MIPPAKHKQLYDEQIRGVFGTFGAGMGIRVCFLQAALEANELSKIQLVSEIPGSDRWPVRDLFQRDVDTKRVEESILPWLQDDSKVKFFNPLTLTLVPVDSGNRITAEVPRLVRTELSDLNGQWVVLERDGLYRFRYAHGDSESHREYGIVEWNSRSVRLVAIDGQHRLSALKRYLLDQQGPGYDNFLSWHVPVVISGLDSDSPVDVSILDVVRNMFVYINTQARTPSKSRQILLNDEVVHYVCVQELLQYSHENDVIEDIDKRQNTRVPLLFYDWRGVTENGREQSAPAAIKSVVEVTEWFKSYLMPCKSEEDLELALGISDEHPLRGRLVDGEIKPGDTHLARERFCNHVLPGIAHLFETFTPYSKYIRDVRDAESRWRSKNDVYRHALSQLRFGSHRGGELMQSSIAKAYDEVVQELIDFKHEIPQLLLLEIGMRGVIYAFGALRNYFHKWNKSESTDTWLPYARWFTKYLNEMYADGWFHNKNRSIRLHITHNAADNIINHKILDSPKAFGALVVIVVGTVAYRKSDCICEKAMWDELWKDFAVHTLGVTLRSGYEKQYASDLRSNNQSWSIAKVKNESKKKAEQAAHLHLGKIETALKKSRKS